MCVWSCLNGFVGIVDEAPQTMNVGSSHRCVKYECKRMSKRSELHQITDNVWTSTTTKIEAKQRQLISTNNRSSYGICQRSWLSLAWRWLFFLMIQFDRRIEAKVIIWSFKSAHFNRNQFTLDTHIITESWERSDKAIFRQQIIICSVLTNRRVKCENNEQRWFFDEQTIHTLKGTSSQRSGELL